jgi:glycosyltransferase involved in cell wall biosynthesis
MRVAVDVTALLTGDTGVARYVRQLSRHSAALDVDLVPFAVGRGEHRDQLPPGTRTTRVPLRLVQRSWAVGGPPAAERLAPGCDVVHTPDLVPPPTRRPLVLTVHDVVALEHPDLHPPRSVAAQERQLAAARARAAVVICVSHATAEAVAERGVDPARVAVVPNGTTALPEPDPGATPAGRFLLAVGSLTPRKGLDTLIEGFVRAGLPDDVRLVLAGPPGWRGETVEARIAGVGATRRVLAIGRVSDAQLSSLYQQCVAVCAASVAEGFGLPVLEAAAAGAPVLASDIPVFRELGAAVDAFVPVGDPWAWADALSRAVDDADLRRSSASARRAVAAEHSWARTAELTVAAYHRAREAA